MVDAVTASAPALLAPALDQPPRAPRVPSERTHHGDVVVDDYEWLRAGDESVRAHVDAENAWTTARTGHLAGLRETIFAEIKGRTQEDDLSVPVREGDWWYYRRTVAGAQYALFCRLAAASSWEPPALPADGSAPEGEVVMLDGNAEAGGSAFFALGAASVSPDGQLLAYSVDTTGDERFTLHVRDLATGADLADEIPGVFYGATWAADSATLWYTVVDDSWRPHQVRAHVVGTDAADDAVVLTEDDERFWLGAGRTRSGRYLVLSAESKTSTQTWLVPADRPTERPQVVLARREGVEAHVEHAVVGGRDVLLVLHNDGAEDFELAGVDVSGPDGLAAAAQASAWTTLVAHEPGRRLEDVDAFAGHVALAWRREGLPRVAVLTVDADGLGKPQEVAFSPELSAVGVGDVRAFDAPLLRLVHTSFTVPASVHDLDVATGTLHLRKRTPVLGGYDAAAYVEHREWAVAPDGTRVPLSVVARADVPRDGSAPALLYGYGSYEISTDPGFSTSRLSLLDRGVVFAVAHVRGGGEMGRAWYDGGKQLAKPNSFSDFVAAARHLGGSGWADARRIVAMGGSAGGLLVGAALNLAPDVFAGVVAAVPFVDPLTTMLDESLPLTVTEQEEWGDPIRDEAVYRLMKAYSPYEGLRPGVRYPPVLATTSLHDTRVLSVEPTKWVARLRELADDGAPQVLLKTETDGGHGGRSGRYEAWKERAFEYAWVLDVLGLAADPVMTERP